MRSTIYGTNIMRKVVCTKLKARYEHLYSSFAVSVEVNSSDMRQEIDICSCQLIRGHLVYLFADISNRKMECVQNDCLRLATFNCRSVKNCFPELYRLCDSHDFVLLQEHWLLPPELGMLNSVHPDFVSYAQSAVDQI